MKANLLVNIINQQTKSIREGILSVDNQKHLETIKPSLGCPGCWCWCRSRSPRGILSDKETWERSCAGGKRCMSCSLSLRFNDRKVYHHGVINFRRYRANKYNVDQTQDYRRANAESSRLHKTFCSLKTWFSFWSANKRWLQCRGEKKLFTLKLLCCYLIIFSFHQARAEISVFSFW